MDQKNLLFAVLISLAVLVGFQYLYEKPRQERAAQQAAQQQAAQQSATPATPAAPGTPSVPGVSAPQLSAQVLLVASPGPVELFPLFTAAQGASSLRVSLPGASS